MSQSQGTNSPPEDCSYEKLVKGQTGQTQDNQWTHKIFAKCYTAILGEKTQITQLKEENKKLKEDSYSGTSVAAGSIGAGTAGLACGLGLFPCLVKLVSKFR